MEPPNLITVYSHASPFHDIHVEDVGHLRVLRFERNRQSSMYLDAPFDTDFEYPAYLHTPLALKPDAQRTLIIGLGGGTVVKRMWRDYPGMRVDVAELDPDMVEVARRFFRVPDDDRIRVFAADGRAYLETSPETYDIVIVDAFDEDRVPRPLTTEEFLRLVRDRLAPDGVVAYNFIGAPAGDHSKPFRSLYKTMANVWRRVIVFVADEGLLTEGANLILLGSDADVSDETLRSRLADRVGGIVTVPAFDRFGEDIYSRGIPTGDVAILTDAPQGRTRRR